MLKELITLKQLIEYMHVSRDTLYRWLKANKHFPKPMKIGRKNLWKKSEIDEYLENKRVK